MSGEEWVANCRPRLLSRILYNPKQMLFQITHKSPAADSTLAASTDAVDKRNSSP